MFRFVPKETANDGRSPTKAAPFTAVRVNASDWRKKTMRNVIRGTKNLSCVTRGVRRGAIGCILIVAGFTDQALAAEVNGIYTDNSTKDIGEVTGVQFFKGVKFRGWLEGYYVNNFNNVARATANTNQTSSVIQSRDATVEGRAFDVHNKSFTLNLAEIEIEKVPETGGVGFKLDYAQGDTQDIIFDSIRAVSPQGVGPSDRNFQHASISYLAPVGTGLRFDFGKFVTHIGGETIESIKNLNFSHAFFYTYGIPFQDSGVRMNYAWSPKFYNEIYLLNGWNVTSDNNTAKTIGLTSGWTPTDKLTVYANYLGGPERNDNNEDWRHLLDMQIMFNPSDTLQTMVNVDIAKDKNALGAGQDAKWNGVALYLRKIVTPRFFPTLRLEYYNDADGFTTGVKQKLKGYTLTGDYKLGKKDAMNLMVRPEIRYDKSNAKFFSDGGNFRSREDQLTIGVGLVAYY